MPLVDTISLKVIERLPGWHGRFGVTIDGPTGLDRDRAGLLVWVGQSYPTPLNLILTLGILHRFDIQLKFSNQSQKRRTRVSDQHRTNTYSFTHPRDAAERSTASSTLCTATASSKSG